MPHYLLLRHDRCRIAIARLEIPQILKTALRIQ